ncbi:hypothetical protein [Conexibacter sp. SYSU D00693]|uniref:hypothetical protein n=1 Tax=Conexibacter sp. SYSU D00693 TaxID=2812560 RepID=UPI00196B37A2|nr:hypothetical protein [Conexibacter sp. SYSU D00693]
MVAVLVIPDGGAEPRHGREPTSLERARTPVLDALRAAGTVRRVATTPAGLPAGSETGIPTLLGAPPRAPVSRGLLEAASAGIDVPAGARAWRVDLHREDGTRATAGEARRALEDLGLHHLRGHRGLAVGATAPRLPAPWRVWGDGAALPRVLDARTVVVSGPGAAAGAARMLGARSVVPAGATGEVHTNLRAKLAAALAAVDGGAERVVVHVGAPDEAAHALDADAKVAALEAIDAELLGALWDAARGAGGTLTVCPDHGTDPRTGEHCGADVEAVAA